jgi:CDP-diacylglycerol--glycerol-3-phosphate 3-phosphatidyltransferase
MAAAGSVTISGIVMWKADERLVFLLMPLWLLVRMSLNAVDGMLAREFDQKSRLGAYLNEIGDVVSDAALYAPFALVAPFGPIDVAAVIFLSILTEFAGVLGPPVGASRRYDGPLGKSDRALVFGALACWIGLGGALPGSLFWLMPAIGLLLLVTTVNRVRAGLAEVARGRIG